MTNIRTIKVKIGILILLGIVLSGCWFLESKPADDISLTKQSMTTVTIDLSAINISSEPRIKSTVEPTHLIEQLPTCPLVEKCPTCENLITQTIPFTQKESSLTVTPIEKTGSPTPLKYATQTPTQAAQIPPGWIVFASYGGDYPWGIDIIHTSGKGWRRIAQAEFPESPIWAPDGQMIAYIDQANNQIYLTKPDGSYTYQHTYTSGDKGRLSWSPDGRKIAYIHTPDFNGYSLYDLYIIDVETGQIHQLTDTPEINEFSPVWSPRGDKIAFVSIYVDARPRIIKLMVMDVDGNNIQSISDLNMRVSSLAWSPDSNQIVFSAGDKCGDLYIINVDGSGLRSLTNDPGEEDTPTWSPDGEWIAYANNPCHNGIAGVNGTRIYLIQSDGNGRQQLIKSTSVDTKSPSWSPIPGLQIGKKYAITKMGFSINIHKSPSLSSTILETVGEGVRIWVLEGPVEADEYLWWRVHRLDTNQEGWIVENPGWFMPVP